MTHPIAETMRPRLGWIGTGVMGYWMCRHLLAAGYSVSVYNRSPGKAQRLVEWGAVCRASPAEVAEAADWVFTMVGYPADVCEVIGGERGVLSALRPGGIVVDMTTSEPDLARRLAEQGRTRQIAVLDAPVSGGDVGAREAKLSIMVGGDADAFAKIEPVLAVFGKTCVRMGEAGAGQHCKMVNQILIAGTMIGVVEGLLYAQRAGLDREAVIRVVGQGAAGSWSINQLGPRILAGNYVPGFRVDHFIKDLGIALGAAERMKLDLPGLALAHRLYGLVQEMGQGGQGTHALMLALERMNSA